MKTVHLDLIFLSCYIVLIFGKRRKLLNLIVPWEMLQTFVIYVQIWWKECLRLHEDSEKQLGAKVPLVSVEFVLLEFLRYSWKSLSSLARNVGRGNMRYVSMLNNSPEPVFPCWLHLIISSLVAWVIGTVWVIWGKQQNNFCNVYLLESVP